MIFNIYIIYYMKGLIFSWIGSKNLSVHWPEILPKFVPWQGTIPPLDHQCITKYKPDIPYHFSSIQFDIYVVLLDADKFRRKQNTSSEVSTTLFLLDIISICSTKI